jgi:AP-1 complex subunit gamma-1
MFNNGISQQPPTPTALTCYEKNGVKITLTPQTSRQHPGLVSITARFQVTGGDTATSLSFQAAVPKVSSLTSRKSHHLSFF